MEVAFTNRILARQRSRPAREYRERLAAERGEQAPEDEEEANAHVPSVLRQRHSESLMGRLGGARPNGVSVGASINRLSRLAGGGEGGPPPPPPPPPPGGPGAPAPAAGEPASSSARAVRRQRDYLFTAGKDIVSELWYLFVMVVILVGILTLSRSASFLFDYYSSQVFGESKVMSAYFQVLGSILFLILTVVLAVLFIRSDQPS